MKHFRSRRPWMAIAVVTSLALISAACGSDDDDSATTQPGSVGQTTVGDTSPGSTSASETTPSKEDEPTHGGQLTYLWPFPHPGFDPVVASVNGPSTMQMTAVFDALALESPVDGSVRLRLLESADSEDGLTWKLKLHSGITFSDGTPLNAEAVKFNWERHADPALESVAFAQAQKIESMTVVDDLTLDVRLKAANAQFPLTIATYSLTWIASPTALQAGREAFVGKPVGAGAFLVKEFERGVKTVFEPNPDYYGEPPYLDHVTVLTIADEAQRLSTLRSGGGDALYTVSAKTAADALDAGYDADPATRNGGFAMFFNVSKAPFDDLRARQALAYALDSEVATTSLFGDVVAAVKNPFIDSVPYHDSRLDQLDPDDTKAQQLFDELAAEKGSPLEVRISYIPPAFTPEAEWLVTKLASFKNVTASLVPVETAVFQKTYGEGDFEVGIHSFSFLDPDFLTQVVGTGGAQNYMHYSNAEVDALLQQGRTELDQDARVPIYQKAMEKVSADVPLHFIHRANSWQFHDSDVVHGLDLDSLVSSLSTPLLQEVWVTR